MYYKAFVLLRLPVSILCLGGFGLLNVWRAPGMGFFGFVVVVGLLVFLAVTTRRLVRRRRGAFRLAWRLLLLEFVGAVLLVGSHDIVAWRNMGYVFAWACTVLVVTAKKTSSPTTTTKPKNPMPGSCQTFNRPNPHRHITDTGKRSRTNAL